MNKDLDLYHAAHNQFETIKNELLVKGNNEELVYSKKLNLQRASSWTEWTVGELINESHILQVQDGNHGETHPKSSDYVDKGIPFIMANTLSNGEILFAKTKKLPLKITEKLRIGFSSPDDVLLSHKGTVGEVAIVPHDLEWPYLMLTPQVTYYRLNSSKILSRFLFYVFTSSYFKSQLGRLSSQSTRAYVGITAQRSLKLLLPKTLDEQLKITEFLEKYVRNIESIESKIRHNKALKENLIYKVL
jgi:type I restriction enzyme S subunit